MHFYFSPMQAAEFVPKSRGKRSRSKKTKKRSRLLRPFGIETKSYDVTSGDTEFQIEDTPASTLTNISPTLLDSFNSPIQGDTSASRDGRQITMQSIQLRGHVRFPATLTAGTIGPQTVRMVLCVDHQCNNFAAQVQWQDVFVNSARNGDSGVFAVVPDRLCTYMYRNLSNNKRFTVLWDEVIQYNYDDTYVTTTVAGVATVIKTNGGIYNFHVLRDLKDMVVNFTTNNGNATDITDNNIMLLAIALPVTAGSSLPFVDYVSRLRFRG